MFDSTLCFPILAALECVRCHDLGREVDLFGNVLIFTKPDLYRTL